MQGLLSSFVNLKQQDHFIRKKEHNHKNRYVKEDLKGHLGGSPATTTKHK